MFHNMTKKYQKGNVLAILMLLLMTAALIGGVFMVQRVWRVGTKASGNGLSLSLSTANANVKPGEDFMVSVLLDPSEAKLKISAVSLNLNYPSDKLTVTSVIPGQFFLEKYDKNTTTMLNNIDSSSVGSVKLKLGAPCTIAAPITCYPKGAAGILASIKFKVKDGASGNIPISFDTSSAIAAINEAGQAVADNVLLQSSGLPTLEATISESSEVKPLTATATASGFVGVPRTIEQLRRRLLLLE